MSREDIQKLIGGYASGTLTAQEREALFAAALEDQGLFDALMREEPLRELLQDPVAKSRLHAALEAPARAPWYRGWLRPSALTAAVAGIVAVGIVLVERRTPPARPVEIAKIETAQPPAVALPEAPAAAQAPKPSLAKAAPPRREAPAARQLQRSKDELQTAQPALTAALKQQDAENKAEPKAANPAPLAVPPQVDTRVAVQAQPVIGLTGARPVVGMAVNLRDARTLFSEPAPGVAPAFRSNLVRTEGRGPARAEAVSAPVADAVLTPAAHLGLRYTVWQRPPAGIFEQIAPTAELNAGDEIELQLQANDSGYVYVFEHGADGAWNLLAADRLARMAVYTVPQSGSLRPGESGALDLFVLFSRRPIPDQGRAPVSPADQQVTGSPAERAMYVASTSNDLAAQRIGFAVTLRAQSH